MNKILFEKVLNEWLEEKEHIKVTTYCKYKNLIDLKIVPYLGKINFKKLSNNDINIYFKSKNIYYLSDSTKKLIYIIIKSSIQFGITKKYRKNNIILTLKIKESKPRIVYLTKKEQNILEKYLFNNLKLNSLAILFDLYTGLRLGELCAIQWKDIDFINNTLYISKTAQRIYDYENDSKKTKLIITSPKTESSYRIIPIPKFLIDLLKEFYTTKDNYVFTNKFFPKEPRTLEKYFSTTLKKCNIKPIVFHGLRHTYATRSREAGIDIKILSELLGHSSYKITLDIYVHTSLEFKKNSVNSLVKYLKK